MGKEQNFKEDKEQAIMAGNPINFLKDVRGETKKVTWPSKDETIKSAIAVFVMVAILSVFLFLGDQIMGWLVGLILD